MSYNDYNRNVQLENKITGREPQGACCQDEMIGGKPPVET
jgi:hypothetical protein